MEKHIRAGSLHALALLFSTAALVACGGGPSLPVEGAPVPRPAPAPGTGTDTAFASPASATDTVEAGKLQAYAFAEKAPQQTQGTPQFAGGAVTLGATLSAAQAFAGVALRAYAPNNTGAAPVAPVDASTQAQLKIQLKSSTDALLQVKLHPSPVAADGCTVVVVVPRLLGAGGLVRKDLPDLLSRLRERHAQVQWRLRPTIGEVESVIAAMAEGALRLCAAPIETP